MNHSNIQLFAILQYFEKTKKSENGTIMKLFMLRIGTTNIEMLGREKIMFETLSTADFWLTLNNSCDCNDKSYFLRLELAKHSFNNLGYVIA